MKSRSGLALASVAAIVVFVALGLAWMTRASQTSVFGFEYHVNDTNDDLIDYALKDGNDEIASHHDRFHPQSGLRDLNLILNGHPDSLSVTWRNRVTGKIHANEIDLRPLMPKNIKGDDLDFLIENDRLTVYLVLRTESGGPMTGKSLAIHTANRTIFQSN